MNRRSSVSLGPGASSLILIFVVLAMAVLGVLSLMTARNDKNFSERSMVVIRDFYRLNETAEEHHADVDRILAECAADAETEEAYFAAIAEALPEEMEIEENEIFWTESDGTRTLDCALQVLPLSEGAKTMWIRHDLMAETGDDEWN